MLSVSIYIPAQPLIPAPGTIGTGNYESKDPGLMMTHILYVYVKTTKTNSAVARCTQNIG